MNRTPKRANPATTQTALASQASIEKRLAALGVEVAITINHDTGKATFAVNFPVLGLTVRTVAIDDLETEYERVVNTSLLTLDMMGVSKK